MKCIDQQTRLGIDPLVLVFGTLVAEKDLVPFQLPNVSNTVADGSNPRRVCWSMQFSFGRALFASVHL